MRNRKTQMIIVFILILVVFTGCKSSDYKNAIAAANAQKYSEAIDAFIALGEYKDSKTLSIRYIEKYVNSLVSQSNYSDAIAVYNKYSNVSDFSSKIDDLEKENELLSKYNDVLIKMRTKKYNEGFEILDTLPSDYRNVSVIKSSYDQLQYCPFKGNHINKDGVNDIYQKITFNVEFTDSERFQLHAYKAVYWSDGTVFKDYDYYLNPSDIKNNNTIEVGKFTWVVSADGSITETEKGTTYKYN